MNLNNVISEPMLEICSVFNVLPKPFPKRPHQNLKQYFSDLNIQLILQIHCHFIIFSHQNQFFILFNLLHENYNSHDSILTPQSSLCPHFSSSLIILKFQNLSVCHAQPVSPIYLLSRNVLGHPWMWLQCIYDRILNLVSRSLMCVCKLSFLDFPDIFPILCPNGHSFGSFLIIRFPGFLVFVLPYSFHLP